MRNTSIVVLTLVEIALLSAQCGAAPGGPLGAKSNATFLEVPPIQCAVAPASLPSPSCANLTVAITSTNNPTNVNLLTFVKSISIGGATYSPISANPFVQNICPPGPGTLTTTLLTTLGQTVNCGNTVVNNMPPSCNLTATHNPTPAGTCFTPWCNFPAGYSPPPGAAWGGWLSVDFQDSSLSTNDLFPATGGFSAPFTLTMSVAGPVTTASIAGTPVPATGGSLVASLPWASASHVFSGSVNGPGGSASCSVSVTAYCTGQSFSGGGFTETMTNNPPFCDWTLNNGSVYFRGAGGGCFAPETRLKLSNGASKAAFRISTRDWLWNPVRGEKMRVKKVVVGTEALPLLEVGYAGSIIRVTTKHPMVTAAGVKPAQLVTLEDSLLGEDLKFHRVTEKRSLPIQQGQRVFSFELASDPSSEEAHRIVANGIVTGDFLTQTRLERKLP